MQFRTEVNIPPFPFSIGYKDQMLMLGSCFATNIGSKLLRSKFPVQVNPFGTIYNPSSIANSLNLLLDNHLFTEEALCFENGCWFSFYHHSQFSSPNKKETLERINTEISKGFRMLKQLDVLILTLGTATVYEHKQKGITVSNCHKLPESQFNRYMLSVSETVELLSAALYRLKILRPELKTILTVSPIRHAKDGAQQNQLSKSTLLLACNELCKQHDNTAYFPAYELMMDELRDYRFYADDMLHPSSLAAEYIWQKFINAITDKETQSVIKEVDKLVIAKEHRPFNPDAAEHKFFLSIMLDKTRKLKERHPYLNLDDELNYFNL